MAAVIGDQARAQGPVGRRLQARVDGGAHRQPALVEALFAVEAGQLAAHLLGEVVGLDHLGGVAPADLQGLRPGLVGFRLGDAAIFQHAADHPVAPDPRRIRVADRVVVVGRLGQGRQEGRLGDGQLVERLVEVVQRRRRYAVGAEAEEDLVQVEFEDMVLGEGLFDAQGDDRLADLALDRDLVGQQEVLGHLLGDGRSADRPPVLAQVPDVHHHRAGDGQRIDAAVAVEILVLGRQEGVDHPPGDRVDRHEDPLFRGVFGQQPAVACMHPGDRGRLVAGKLLVIRQVPGEFLQQEQRQDPGGQDRQHRHAEEVGKNLKHTCRLAATLPEIPWSIRER